MMIVPLRINHPIIKLLNLSKKSKLKTIELLNLLLVIRRVECKQIKEKVNKIMQETKCIIKYINKSNKCIMLIFLNLMEVIST